MASGKGVSSPTDITGCEASPSRLEKGAIATSTISASNDRTVAKQWKTGIWKRFPYTSLISLILVLVLGAGLVIVLTKSDGHDVNTWGTRTYHYGRGWKRSYTIKMTPNTWIALLMFFASKLLALAFAEAATLAWWTGAMHGKSLRQLHHDWDVGRGISGVIKRPTLFNWLCVASVLSAAFSGFSTLFQKASDTTARTDTYAQSMNASLATGIPSGFSGIYNAGVQDIGFLTPAMVQIAQNYQFKTPMVLNVTGCDNSSDATCSATFQGVGFQYDCVASEKSFWAAKILPNHSLSPEKTTTIFSVAVEWSDQLVPGASAWGINITTLAKETTDCTGNLNIQRCTMVPALVEYPVSISQGIVTLRSPQGAVNWAAAAGFSQTPAPADTVVKVLDFPGNVNDEGPYEYGYPTPSTLGGVAKLMQELFDTTVNLTYTGSSFGYFFESSGSYSIGFTDQLFGSNDGCNTSYNDPLPSLISNIREVMFRSTLLIAQEDIRDSNQTAANPYNPTNASYIATMTDQNGTQTIIHAVYRTNHTLLGIGAGLMVFCVLAMLPLYADFWMLGRNVSLSPLEMAKALHAAQDTTNVFDTTMDEQGNHDGTNAESNELIDMLGEIKVKYGEVAPGKLGLGLHDAVTSPSKGQVYH